MSKMSSSRIEKIGGKSLLDKAWSDRPISVIKNPHKLTENELYRTLEKIVELPETRLKAMLKSGNQAVDEVFLLNVAERIPHFLTATIVNITKTLLLQRDYFKDHGIWKPLEAEIFKRRNNLNNE
jgi:restriction endonuclease